MFRFLFATIKRDVLYHLSFTFTLAFSWMFALFKLTNRFCCSLNPKTNVVILDAAYMKLWDEARSLFHKLFWLIFTSFLFYYIIFCWCILLLSSLSDFLKWDHFHYFTSNYDYYSNISSLYHYTLVDAFFCLPHCLIFWDQALLLFHTFVLCDVCFNICISVNAFFCLPHYLKFSDQSLPLLQELRQVILSFC